jgi:hypothetical protein
MGKKNRAQPGNHGKWVPHAPMLMYPTGTQQCSPCTWHS